MGTSCLLSSFHSPHTPVLISTSAGRYPAGNNKGQGCAVYNIHWEEVCATD